MCCTMCPVNESALIVSIAGDVDASSAITPPTQHHSRAGEACPAIQPRPYSAVRAMVTATMPTCWAGLVWASIGSAGHVSRS